MFIISFMLGAIVGFITANAFYQDDRSIIRISPIIRQKKLVIKAYCESKLPIWLKTFELSTPDEKTILVSFPDPIFHDGDSMKVSIETETADIEHISITGIEALMQFENKWIDCIPVIRRRNNSVFIEFIANPEN